MKHLNGNGAASKAGDKTGIALIGAGTVAHLHAKGVVQCSDAVLSGVYDIDPVRSGRLVSNYGGKSYRSFDELLGDSTVKIVHILTPVETHVELSVACLESGRHVLLEKPVAATGEEIGTLIDASARTGRLCIPGHNYIHSPRITRMKRLIAEGAFGRINSFWMMYNLYHDDAKIRSCGGVLNEVGFHHAYSMLYLLGRPDSVYATTGSIRPELEGCDDRVMIVANMPGGAIVNLWASFAADDKSAMPWTVFYKLMGEKGVCSHSWSDAVFEDNGGPAWGLANYAESFAAEIEHFVNRCVRLGEAPLSTLADARDGLIFLEACKASLQSGCCERIDWAEAAIGGHPLCRCPN